MWYHGSISAHHPYYDFGILETNAYEVDDTDYTNVHSIYPYNKKLHAEAKSAECEISTDFYF